MYAEESITIANTSFLNNVVALVTPITVDGLEALGSAVCVDAAQATGLVTAALDSCTFTRNIATHGAANMASSMAAIYVSEVAELAVDSCTFNRNTAAQGGVSR